MKQPVVLRIYQDGKMVAVKQFLTEEQILIGHPGGQAQLELMADDVAPIHALIERRGESFYLADLGSNSGTLLNGKKILDQRLESGDHFQVGPFRVEYFLGVPKPKAPPPKVSLDNVKAADVDTATNIPLSPLGTGSPAPTLDFGSLQKEKEELAQEPLASIPIEVAPQIEIQRKPVSEPKDPFAVPTDKRRQRPPIVVANPSQPRVRGHKKKKHRWDKSFAPASQHNSVHEIVKPSKGTVVEVLVAWKERIISTYHFSEKADIFAGNGDGVQVVIPGLSAKRKFPIVKIDSQAAVFIPQGSEMEVVKGNSFIRADDLHRTGRLQAHGAFQRMNLEQGELIKITLNDTISLVIRYVSHTPRPLAAPFFDVTGTEFLTVALAVIMAGMMYLYTSLYPNESDIERPQEPIRAAILIEKPPQPTPNVPVPPPPAPVAHPAPEPTKSPEPIKVENKTQVAQVKTDIKSQQQAESPNPKPVSQPKKETSAPPQQVKARENPTKSKGWTSSTPQGAAVKTASKEGSQAKSESKDISKSKIFSVFGGGGQQKSVDTGYSGAGELSGLADSATGTAGQAENRAGDGLGAKFKDTGGSGKGKSNVGVAGLSISTSGRGSGNIGYGSGGLGGKQGVNIIPGGSEEEFKGTVDREAVRRVVRQHMREIQLCYDRALNRNPGLSGKIVIGWDVGEQGRVIRAQGISDRSTIEASSELTQCIVNRLKGWTFPEPPRNEVYTVSYPFALSATN